MFVNKGSFEIPDVPNPVLVIDSEKPVEGINDFPCSYLFRAKDARELKDVFDWFQTSPLWNTRLSPRRKQLMVLDSDLEIEDVFNYMHKRHVIEMAVVVKLHGGLWKGYKREICGNHLNSTVFRCGDGLRLGSYPKKLSGCNFTASLIQTAYALHKPEDPKNNPGILTKPLYFLIWKYHLNVTFIIPPIEDHKKFFLGIECITNLSMAHHELISASPARIGSTSKFYELSNIVLRANRVWLVPKAKKLPNYQILASIFDGIIWIGVLVSIVVTVSVVWIISKVKHIKKFDTLSECLVNVIQISIGSSLENIPDIRLLKFLFLAYFLYSMHIIYFFQTKLSGVLTVPTYEKTVHSSHDLADSELTPLLFFEGDHHLINMSANPLARIIHKKCVVTNENRTTEMVWKHRNVSALYSIGSLTRTDMKLVNYFPDDLLVRSEIMYILPNGSFYLRYVNDIIDVSTENGFMLKWTAEWTQNQEKNFDGNVVLTMEHLQGAFYLLFLGYLASTAAFIVEKTLFTVTKQSSIILS